MSKRTRNPSSGQGGHILSPQGVLPQGLAYCPGPRGLSRLSPPVPPRKKLAPADKCRAPASLGVDQTGWTRRVELGAKGHGRHRNSSPRRRHGPHRSVGRARRAWVAGGPPPDPRWRAPRPEGAAGKGHLDLQPAWPSRSGPCPSARTSPQARVPAAGAP